MGIGYGIAFFLLFFCFQNPTIYHATLGKISTNYQRISLDSAQRVKVKTPFSAISDENLVHWDAEYYDNIRNNQYFSPPPQKDKAKETRLRENTFAFFPLFAWIWKMSFLPAKGVILLNFNIIPA